VRAAGEILLLSCYELGRQPLAVASAAALLRRAGYRPAVRDLSLDRLEPAELGRARLVAISVPMHTALRLGVAVARRIRELAPDVPLCFFGMYATLNSRYLLHDLGADAVIGGEFEQELLALARSLLDGPPARIDPGPPSRTGLPPLERYARLEIEGETRLAGAVETTRGCLHRCRHCPIPPVYAGRLVVLPRETVLEDVRRLVAAGARHVTFADPDFLNGPTHSLRIVRALHDEHPGLTFDFTSKVELLLRHRRLLGELRRRGALFAVSAVESLSDEVLANLDKGHTRRDVFDLLDAMRETGIALRPTFVPFTPWAGLDDYEQILDWIERESLWCHVDPVQLSIRLLVPPGSLLERHPGMTPHLGGLRRQDFAWSWRHPDPRMDDLQRDIEDIVVLAAAEGSSAEKTFGRIRRASARFSGIGETRVDPAVAQRRPPRLTEAWFC